MDLSQTFGTNTIIMSLYYMFKNYKVCGQEGHVLAIQKKCPRPIKNNSMPEGVQKGLKGRKSKRRRKRRTTNHEHQKAPRSRLQDFIFHVDADQPQEVQPQIKISRYKSF